MLNVAREQCGSEQNPLEDDVIEICIQPKVGADKVLADAVQAVVNDLEKIQKKFGQQDREELNDAVAYLDKLVQDEGGTTKQKKAAAALAKKQQASATAKP
jgi:hypothetical protein